MKGIIDFHTHAFPDELAERAINILLEEGQKRWNVKAYLDGKISSLISSMDKNGIEKSIICSIATKPAQFNSIISWSKKIMSDRIIPFPSFHPDDSDYVARISQIKDEGFIGIKFHPYYQNFIIDEERLFPVYEEICKARLILVMHTGFDLAFERKRIADPQRIVRIMEQFPDLKLVTTHLGSWEDWEEVEKHIAGKKIYMEISYSLDLLDREMARKIILKHPREYVLFGSDSPWTGQDMTLKILKGLDLGEELEQYILYKNAEKLLNSR